MSKSTRETFDDHLARADRGDVEGDLADNFTTDCVLLTSYGRFEGHAGARAAAALQRGRIGGRWLGMFRLVDQGSSDSE